MFPSGSSRNVSFRFLKLNYLKIKKTKNINFSSIKFFSKDKIYFNLYLAILENYYSHEHEQSIEKIIKSVSNEEVSRPTIFKVIDLSLSKKFITKEKNNNDKRKYTLQPSALTIKEFEEWAKLFKNL